MNAAPSPALELELLRAQIAQAHSSSPGAVWSALEAAADATLTESLGQGLGLPVLRLQTLQGWKPRFDLLPFAECSQRRCGLLDDECARPCLLIVDAFDCGSMAWARTVFGAEHVCLATAETFDAWLAHCERTLRALGAVDLPTAASESEAACEVISLRNLGGESSPAVRFVNSTLYDALKTGASDIHLESNPSGLGVKFRLDGVLTAMGRIDSTELAAQCISRIKVMAQLDIAERRVPQDGRLQVAYESRSIDVRVSIMPSIHGEDAVLRILDRQHLAQSISGLTLAKLGFDEEMAQALRRLCRKPHGMLLVTGPTGSGKTTTLYAAIAETHESRDKIITIEDPVEYQLPGVLQIPVNERKGLSFARGLRSILRHDPDKILVGEIRDAETAQIAIQSSLTGHLVFTTVHANTVFDVVGRFGQFGIDPYTFSSAINAVLAQRLVRRVCSACATGTQVEGRRLLHAVGCEQCRGTGYSGRFALGELLPLTPALKSLVAERAGQVALEAEARLAGWRPLAELAAEAAAAGLTTLEEIERVAA